MPSFENVARKSLFSANNWQHQLFTRCLIPAQPELLNPPARLGGRVLRNKVLSLLWWIGVR